MRGRPTSYRSSVARILRGHQHQTCHPFGPVGGGVQGSESADQIAQQHMLTAEFVERLRQQLTEADGGLRIRSGRLTVAGPVESGHANPIPPGRG